MWALLVAIASLVLTVTQPSSAPQSIDAVQPAAIDAAISDLRQSQSKSRHIVGYQTELPVNAAQREAATSQTQLRPALPTPPPKRPKGRLLIGMMLMALLGTGAFIVWDGIFRFQAYGIVEANKLEVRATAAGIVQRIYVSEGDHVKTGDLLVVIDNLDFDRRLRRTRDELRLAEAQLDATIAKLRWDAQSNAAQLYELTGKLREHRAELQRLDRSLERATKLKDAGAITEEVFDQAQFAKSGKSGLIEMYEEAIANYRRRSESAAGEFEVPLEQLRPALIRIENLRHEIELLQDEAKSTWVRAAMPGLVTKRTCLTGKWVDVSEVLLELVEIGSTKPVVYFAQDRTKQLEPGSQVVIHLEPHETPFVCRVKKLGDEYQPAPAPISRFYDMHEPLLPVTLETQSPTAFPPGAILKVPYELPLWRKWF